MPFFFFFNDTATTEIYTLSLHDALPISSTDMGRRVLAGVIILSLLASACASRNVPPIGAGGRPFKPEADERSLWAKAEKEGGALLKRGKPYEDPLLAE